MVLVLALVIGAGFFGLYRIEKAEKDAEAERAVLSDEPLPTPLTLDWNGRSYTFRDDIDTYLLLGIDEYEDTRTGSESTAFNNQRCDFIMLMAIDRSNHSFSTLEINRDTMTSVPIIGLNNTVVAHQVMQINLSHTYGSGGKDSCRNSAMAVSDLLLGVPVDHYFAVTMEAISLLNDLVDGVTVTIDEDLTPADPAFVEGTTITLHGKQAEHYFRARMSVGDGTNISRLKRQRQFIDNFYQQLIKKMNSSSGFALKLADTLSPYLTSDLVTDEFARLADQLKDYSFEGIRTLDGTPKYEGTAHGFSEFYVDEDALRRQVVEMFFA